MSESFRTQIKNLKSKLQEKRQFYMDQEVKQNSEIDEIKTELQNLRGIISELENRIETKLESQNENKLKDFDEIFNSEMEKLKADLLDILENSEIVNSTAK